MTGNNDTVAARLPRELRAELEARAAIEGRPLSAVIRALLAEAVRNVPVGDRPARWGG